MVYEPIYATSHFDCLSSDNIASISAAAGMNPETMAIDDKIMAKNKRRDEFMARFGLSYEDPEEDTEENNA